MARPTKQGLDYYPLDVGFLKDIKFRKIKKSCGAYTTEILMNLLGSIYSESGYYVKWDDDLSFLVADEVGTSEDEVNKTVDKSLQVDFFDKEIFDNYKILTSRGIQKRFFTAISRRKEIEIITDILLVEIEEYINDNNNLVYVNINSQNVISNEQSKVKESKVEESKVKKSKTRAYFPDDAELDSAFVNFVEMRKKIKSPMTDHAIDLSIKKLGKLADDREEKIKILENSIMNSWKGLFPLNDKSSTKSNGNEQSFEEKWRNA